MNETLPHNDVSSGTNWYLLGDFQTTLELESDLQFQPWLVTALNPLNVPPAMLEKITASIVKSPAGGSNGLCETIQRTIRVYASLTAAPPGKSWGFFRTEKKDDSLDNGPCPHTITLYLYVEGKERIPGPNLLI